MSLEDLSALLVTHVSALLHVAEQEKDDSAEMRDLKQEITRIHEIIVEKRLASDLQSNQLLSKHRLHGE
jgi:hypothetical protein